MRHHSRSLISELEVSSHEAWPGKDRSSVVRRRSRDGERNFRRQAQPYSLIIHSMEIEKTTIYLASLSERNQSGVFLCFFLSRGVCPPTKNCRSHRAFDVFAFPPSPYTILAQYLSFPTIAFPDFTLQAKIHQLFFLIVGACRPLILPHSQGSIDRSGESSNTSSADTNGVASMVIRRVLSQEGEGRYKTTTISTADDPRRANAAISMTLQVHHVPADDERACCECSHCGEA